MQWLHYKLSRENFTELLRKSTKFQCVCVEHRMEIPERRGREGVRIKLHRDYIRDSIVLKSGKMEFLSWKPPETRLTSLRSCYKGSQRYCLLIPVQNCGLYSSTVFPISLCSCFIFICTIYKHLPTCIFYFFIFCLIFQEYGPQIHLWHSIL